MIKSNFINGLVAKFKSQFLPIRDEKLGIYLPTGDIAKEVKPEEKGDDVSEYRVFINGTLTNVPAALVSKTFPVYRISKPVSQLVVGDIIRTGDSKKYTYRRVTKIYPDGRIESDSFGGTVGGKINAITDLVLGSKTVSVVVNFMKGFNTTTAEGGTQNFLQNPLALALFNNDDDDDSVLSTMFMLQALNNNQNNTNNMLPLLLLSKDGGSSAKDILLMSLINGGSTANMNQLLPLLLLDKDGDSGIDDMLLFSMIGNGNNPFLSLFNTPVVAPTTAAPASGTHA